MSFNIGDTISDGTLTWTLGRKISNAPNVLADCDAAMEGSIKQFDSTTSNIPAVGAEGNLVTVGLASSKAQIAVTSDNKVYYRSYASSTWGSWQRLTNASEIVDSMSGADYTGWLKFGALFGGLKIQYGLSTVTGGNIGFPISFNTIPSVTVARYTSETTQYAAVSGVSKNNFAARINGTTNTAIFWIAVGF